MAVKIEDVDLKDLNKIIETAQLELTQATISYNNTIKKLGKKTVENGSAGDITVAHAANIKSIKQRYAKYISNVCSRMLK